MDHEHTLQYIYIYPSIDLFLYLSIHLPLCLPVSLPICLFIIYVHTDMYLQIGLNAMHAVHREEVTTSRKHTHESSVR